MSLNAALDAMKMGGLGVCETVVVGEVVGEMVGENVGVTNVRAAMGVCE